MRSCLLVCAWSTALLAFDCLGQTANGLGTDSAADRVSTGNKTLDLLLDARIAPDEPASAPKRATRHSPSSGASSPIVDDDIKAPTESLREALLRDAASHLQTHTKVNETDRTAQLEVSQRRFATSDVGPTSDVRRYASGDDVTRGPSFSISVLATLREYRYGIMAAAVTVLVLVGLFSGLSRLLNRKPIGRADAVHSSGRRRRRRRG